MWGRWNARRFGWMRGSLLLIAGAGAVGVQTPGTFVAGSINFFGGQGLDLARVRAALTLHSGDAIAQEDAEAIIARLKAEVLSATGRPATDVAIICCDQPGRPDFYIGLAGQSYREIERGPTPSGGARLDPQAILLYKKYTSAWEDAVRQGDAGEDDSAGYALSSYEPARKVEMAMRDYALAHPREIERALADSREAEERQAAATLLGYAARSPGQLAALTAAINDADEDVRNNAMRALSVMAAATPNLPIDIAPLAESLYSGVWTDRNKASLLLEHLTSTRDAAKLQILCERSMGPLIDGAQWRSSSHAYPFLEILGRIGGIDEAALQKMIDARQQQQIISAALLKRPPAKADSKASPHPKGF